MKIKLYHIVLGCFVCLAVSISAHANQTVKILDVKNDTRLNNSADPSLAAFYVVDSSLESFKSAIRFSFEQEPKDLDWSEMGLEIAFADCSDQLTHRGRSLQIEMAEGAFSKADSNLYVAAPDLVNVRILGPDGSIERLNPGILSLKASILRQAGRDGVYLAELEWDRGVSDAHQITELDQSAPPLFNSNLASLKLKGSVLQSIVIAESASSFCKTPPLRGRN